jgi:hypothetical protein
MPRFTGAFRMPRFAAVALAIGLVIGAWAIAPAPAAAQFFFGGPRFFAPYPYYPPPAYYPYYAPPPAYYPPPAPAYYPPPAATAPAAGTGTATSTAAAGITYTSRPAFKNAAGQTCREFKAASGALGTACEDPSGQWRVAN